MTLHQDGLGDHPVRKEDTVPDGREQLYPWQMFRCTVKSAIRNLEGYRLLTIPGEHTDPGYPGG